MTARDRNSFAERLNPEERLALSRLTHGPRDVSPRSQPSPHESEYVMPDLTPEALAAAETLAAEAKFRNPSLAVRMLDLTADSTGDADVSERLAHLAKDEPYLLTGDGRPRPKPDEGQGGYEPQPPGSLRAGQELFKTKHGRKT